MGRFTKKIVIIYSILLLAWLPEGATAESVDCLFHDDNAPIVSHSHQLSDSMHQSAFDLSDIDLSNIQDSPETNSKNSGSSCPTHILVVAISDSFGLYAISWDKSFFHDQSKYRLTTISLSQDIRPPISILS